MKSKRGIIGLWSVVLLLTFTAILWALPGLGAGAETYTVTFYTMNADGEPVMYQSSDFANPQQVPAGTAAVFPAGSLDVLEGYAFTGWDHAPDVAILEDTQIHALYRPLEVASVVVEYQYDDGSTASQSYTSTFVAGTDIDLTIPLPVVTGFAPREDETVPGFAISGESVRVTIPGAQGNHIYRVKYAPGQVAYHVVVHKEQLGGGYSNEAPVAYTATVGDEVSAVPEAIEGYHCITAGADLTTTVAAEGTSEIHLYYDLRAYALEFDLGEDGRFADDTATAYEVKFGAPLPLIDSGKEPVRAGYSFAGWLFPDKETYTTMPGHDVVIRANWEPLIVPYKALVWCKSADPNDSGEYTYEYIEEISGTDKGGPLEGPTGSIVALSKETIMNNGKTIEEDWGALYYFEGYETGVAIAGDGSTIVNIYMDRNSPTINFFFYDPDLCVTNGGEDSGHVHVAACYKEVYKITGRVGSSIRSHFTNPTSDFAPYAGGSLWREGPTMEESFVSIINYVPSDGMVQNYYGVSVLPTYHYIGNYWMQVIDENGELVTDFAGFNLHYVQDARNNYSSMIKNLPVFGYDGYEYMVGESDALSDTLSEDGRRRLDWPRGIAGQTVTMNMYYKLREFPLTLHFVKNAESTDVLYTQLLSRVIAGTPEPPIGYEDYTFAGWYDTKNFTGDPVDLSATTMPLWGYNLYAKWEPPVYDVVFNAQGGDPTPESQRVTRGLTAGAITEPERNGYTFGGWYREAACVNRFFFTEKIYRDTTVYAKWIPNSVAPYTVKHLIYGTDTPVPGTSEDQGEAAVGITFTVYAKSLSNYSPDAVSKAMQMANQEGNEVIFYYKPFTTADYTVRYVDKDGNDLIEPKAVLGSTNAIVTEQRELILGYTPDAYQQTVAIHSGEANEILFMYTRNANAGEYVIISYYEQLDGSYSRSVAGPYEGIVGTEATAVPEMPLREGYSYSSERSVTKGRILSTETLVLSLVYPLNRYEYTVEHFHEGRNEIMESQSYTGIRHGQTITASRKVFQGLDMIGVQVNGAHQKWSRTVTMEIVENHVVIRFRYLDTPEEPEEPEEELPPLPPVVIEEIEKPEPPKEVDPEDIRKGGTFEIIDNDIPLSGISSGNAGDCFD